MAPQSSIVRLERLPPFTRPVIVVVALAILYAGLLAVSVRPYLWPAGTGALLGGEPASVLPIRARPPDIRSQFAGPLVVTEVAAGSPAAALGVAAGDQVLGARRLDDDHGLALDGRLADPADRLARWRQFYWMGVSQPVEWTIQSPDHAPRVIRLDRPSARSSGSDGWARRHLGIIVDTGFHVCCVGAAGASQQRPHRVSVRAGVVVQRSRRRGPAVRCRTVDPLSRAGADDIRLARKRARVSIDRARDRVFSDSVAAARALPLAARGPTADRGPPFRTRLGHRPVCGRRRIGAWSGSLGRVTPGAQSRRICDRACGQRPGHARGLVSVSIPSQRGRTAAHPHGLYTAVPGIFAYRERWRAHLDVVLRAEGP
jgi:hypothetical protein